MIDKKLIENQITKSQSVPYVWRTVAERWAIADQLITTAD